MNDQELDATLDQELAENNAEKQSADIAAAWVTNCRAYVQDYGNDHYHVIIVNRGGTVIADFETEIEEDGESRQDVHWIKSLKGSRLKADEAAATYGQPRDVSYNTLTGDVK